MTNIIYYNRSITNINNLCFSNGFLGKLFNVFSYPLKNSTGFIIKYNSCTVILIDYSYNFYFSDFFFISCPNFLRYGVYSFLHFRLFFGRFSPLTNSACLQFYWFDPLDWRNIRFFFNFFGFSSVIVNTSFLIFDNLPDSILKSICSLKHNLTFLLESRISSICYSLFFSTLNTLLMHLTKKWSNHNMSDSELLLFNFQSDVVDYSDFIFFSDFNSDCSFIFSGVFLDGLFISYEFYYFFNSWSYVSFYNSFFCYINDINTLFIKHFLIYYFYYYLLFFFCNIMLLERLFFNRLYLSYFNI